MTVTKLNLGKTNLLPKIHKKLANVSLANVSGRPTEKFLEFLDF